jgi:hypothetical protein
MDTLTKEVLSREIEKMINEKPRKIIFIMSEFERELYRALYGKEPVEGEMHCGMEIVFSKYRAED